MRKTQIETGVVYALWKPDTVMARSPRAVVFLAKPTDGAIYAMPSHGRDKRDDGSALFQRNYTLTSPSRNHFGPAAGYPVVLLAAKRVGGEWVESDKTTDDLLAVTLREYEQVIEQPGDGLRYSILTDMSEVWGTYEQAMLTHRERERIRVAEAQRVKDNTERCHVARQRLTAALTLAGIEHTTPRGWDGRVEFQFSPDAAHALAERLESA